MLMGDSTRKKQDKDFKVDDRVHLFFSVFSSHMFLCAHPQEDPQPTARLNDLR